LLLAVAVVAVAAMRLVAAVGAQAVLELPQDLALPLVQLIQ
jgi:hypothetical protein